MRRPSRRILFFTGILILLVGFLPPGGSSGVTRAQSGAPQAPQNTPPAPPSQKKKDSDYRITRDVNLVVLHATVLDDRGKFVSDLKQEYFRVFEDRVEQKLSLFKREDIPISVGLVIDNSGSMAEKRASVNAAALAFVQASNREDEAFVVNFNEENYLDLDKDFTNDINELKEALERIDSRGITALYDAVIASLDHLKKGTRDKKVLLVVTDGEDNASRVGGGNKRQGLELTVIEAQKSDAVIYSIGLLSQERSRETRKSREALTRLAVATGGLAFFPEGLGDVGAICTQIAHDIRNQYTLTYYPTNTKKDGTFRSVNVDVHPPRGRGKLTVRTRTGYFAQKETAGTGN
ncbi:MAG: VWA domain-containing protein [Acidobacteria bacterium]|nr:VWA domain-containing protein [Acidobacteriota bacterium]MBI3663684.1 VWA domain-containing protein [Acidobacteriota bacterium]